MALSIFFSSLPERALALVYISGTGPPDWAEIERKIGRGG
jgi:hypothetical protein